MQELETREKILKAADDRFAQVGYDAATTREIAELSGVNKALIHYHFKSKEALLASILDRYYERLNEVIQEAALVEGNMLEKMKSISDAYIDFLSENRNFAKTVQREASGGTYIDRVRAHMVPIFELGMELVQSEYPTAREGDLSGPHLLTTFYGMIVTYFTYSDVIEFLIGKDPLSREELEMRKRHLHRMLELIDRALREQQEVVVKGEKAKERG